MKKPKFANFWADITVYYSSPTGRDSHDFSRRDFSLEGVKTHCQTDVLRLYKLANLVVEKFEIKYDGKLEVLEVK